MGIVAGSELWILEAALNVDHKERTLSNHAADPYRRPPEAAAQVARSDMSKVPSGKRRSSCSADADQLLVDELVGPVAAELASEAGAFRAAER